MQANKEQIKKVSNEVIWKSLKNIVKRFNFKESEARVLMGDMPRATFTTGKSNLTTDQKTRVSYLLGIYKSLRVLFDDSSQAMSWIDRKNKLHPFNGLTPKEYMLEGNMVRLADVRKFLDFWRGH